MFASLRRPSKVLGRIIIVLTAVAILALLFSLLRPVPPQEITQAQLFDLIKQGRVISIINEIDLSTGIRTLSGFYQKPYGAFKVPVDVQLDPSVLSEIKQAGYQGLIETQNNSSIIWPLTINLLPMVLFVVLFFGMLYFLLRTRRST